MPVNLGNHISGLQARFRSRTAGLHSFDDDPVGGTQFLKHDWVRALFFLKAHTDRTPRDLPVRDQVVVRAHGGVRRKRKAHTLITIALRHDGRVDPNYLARHVYKRAARVSGINGCVCLQESLKLPADASAILRADDPGSDRCS